MSKYRQILAAILRLALTNNAEQMATTAFHESYHHVEDRLQTEAERKLMKAETERMRGYIKGKTAMTDAQVDEVVEACKRSL